MSLLSDVVGSSRTSTTPPDFPLVALVGAPTRQQTPAVPPSQAPGGLRAPPPVLRVPPTQAPPAPQGMPPGGTWYQNGRAPGEMIYVPPGGPPPSSASFASEFFANLDRFYQQIFQNAPDATVNGVTRRDFVAWRDLSRRGAAGDLSIQEFGRLADLQNRLVGALAEAPANDEPLGPPTPLVAPRPTSSAPPSVSYTPPPPPPPVVHGTADLTLGGSTYTLRNTSDGFEVVNPDYNVAYRVPARTLSEARDFVKGAWLSGALPGPTPSESPLTIAGQSFSIVGNNGTYGLRDPAGALIYQLPGRTLAEASEYARAAYFSGDVPGFPPQSNPLTIDGRTLDIVGSHGDFGLRLPNGDYAGRVRAASLPDAVAQVETLYLQGRIPGLPPNRLTIALEPGLEVRILGSGESGPYGIADLDGNLLARIRVPKAGGGDRHPTSFDEAAQAARDLFSSGALAPFGLSPDATFPAIPDPWETDPEPLAPTPAPASPPTPAPQQQPLLPPAVPPNAPLLPAAGETGGSVDDADTGSGDGSGDSRGPNGPGGPPRTGGPGGPDDEEPPPENLNFFQQWLKKSIENWNALRGNAAERAQQFRDLVGTTIRTVGTGFGIANAAGLAGGAIFYGGLQEERTGPPVTPDNAYDELAKLQADPLAYLEGNYENALAGLNVGDRLYNMSGNLLEFTRPDGTVTHFRRVPEDLFLALREAQARAGNPSEQVFVQESYTRPDGTVDILNVEIRPPFRAEPLRDATIYGQIAEDSRPWSFAVRGGLRFGPPEGQNINIGGNANLNYRLDSETVSTFRVGLQPPNGGDAQIGIRQQNTSPWTGLGLNATAIDINPFQVRDLTDPTSPFSDNRLVIANARVYAVAGNRDRVRLDVTSPEGLSGSAGGAYARARETGFFEVGLAGDFMRFVDGDDWYSANGYLELQLYSPDLRGQLGLGDKPPASGGLQPFPLFEVDPALQLSTDALPRITPDLGPLRSDEVQWEDPVEIRGGP